MIFFQDPYVQMYMSLCDREIRHSGRHSLHTNFSLDHPIEEAGRLLSATLLRHTHLTPQLIEVLEQGMTDIEDCYFRLDLMISTCGSWEE